MKRGYYSFLFLTGAYLFTFFLPFVMNKRAILVKYDGRFYFPAFKAYWHDAFGWGPEYKHLATVFDQIAADGLPAQGEANYRLLKEKFQEKDEGDFVVLPLIPYHPNEQFEYADQQLPYPPSREHWLGCDNPGRDIMVRLVYGFRTSMSFALVVTIAAYAFGVFVGALLGYFGRWLDMLGLRLVEIWGSVPFLYTVIILAALYPRSFLLLVIIFAAFGWLGITYYVRGEFYREKARDYVSAAIATGEGHLAIIIRHILPNSLTPVITFAPFAIVGSISSLVALDFLGYGLPPPTPSWGELLRQSRQQLHHWHLVVFPLVAMFVTLQLIVFIGEAVREAFDPKVFSRLR